MLEQVLRTTSIVAATQAKLGYYKCCQITIKLYSLLAFSSTYPPRHVSEIKGKIAHGKQPRTHILSKCKTIPTSLTCFYFPICEATDLSRLLRQLSDPKTSQFPQQGFPPKDSPLRLPIWHQSNHLACNSNQKIKQTASFAFFTPPKIPKASTKLCLLMLDYTYYYDVKR